jgi:hypothetical protein
VGEGTTHRYTVTEAADILGISTGAVRSRLSRGTLRSVRESGTVYVLLPASMSASADRDATDTPTDMSQSDSGVLTSELRDRLHYVEGQLEAERQAHAEARRIIAGLVERIPALEAPDSPEPASEEPEGVTPRPGGSPPREGVQRPWWRRMFRG